MPSRKKAKGKARRAAKEAKREEESQAMVAAANQRQKTSLKAQMQRLEINVFTPKECNHGLLPSSSSEKKRCFEFIRTFIAAYATSGDDMYESFTAAHEAVKEEYYDVYSSSSKLEAVVSMLLYNGAQFVLDGDNDTACLYALLACYFEEWISAQVRKSKAFFSWIKVCELDVADDHTLLQCLRRRIPCGCLNKKYEEVKSVKKMGCCFNPSCSLPEGKVERSKMFYCTRCCNANYCSIECQKADWKRHRVDCDIIVGRKAEFDSAKRQGQGKRD